jgi:hypothetical protein
MHLTDIEAFCDSLGTTMEAEDTETTVVIYTGSDDAVAQMHACLLVGAYLMLRRELDLDAVVLAFRPLLPAPAAPPAEGDRDPPSVRVEDCWGALHHALRLGWLAGPSRRAEPLLDAEEFAHYARAAHGGVHLLAPASLYLFATPADLEGGRAWADGAGGRRFSGAFCADLLADLGAAAVVGLDGGPASAAAAFAARGLAAADLGAGRGRPSLLGALDALLTAAGGGRDGAVAVHAAGGHGGGEWPGWAGTLAAAFLVSRHGFRGAAAAGWVHMLCPWLVPPPAAAGGGAWHLPPPAAGGDGA